MDEKRNTSDLRPFLELRKGPINQRHRAPRGGGRTRRSEAIRHGQLLLSQIGQMQKVVDQLNRERPADFPPLPEPVQLVIKGEVDAHMLSRLDLDVVDEREENKFVSISKDSKVERLIDSINTYITEVNDSGTPRNYTLLDPIESISPAAPADRMGVSLKKWIEAGQLNPKMPEHYDIEIAGGRTEEGEANRQQFDAYLQAFKESHFPGNSPPIVHWQQLTVVAETYSVHRVLLPGIVVEDLLNNPRAHWLLLINRIPRIEDDTIRLRQIETSSIPPLPALADNAPRIVIVDSGIATKHPLFDDGNNSIVGRERSFLPTWLDKSGDTADYVERGHGTAVASVAAYGSIRKFLLSQSNDSYPEFWIENAKILYSAARFGQAVPDHDRALLHELQVPHSLMQQVVHAFHSTNPRDCRIFNLSVGAEPHRLDQIQSSWSEAIDNLSAQHNILFVIASGNVQLFEIDTYSKEIGKYPKYLFDPRSRLRDPAQALNALSVGALSEHDIIPATARRSHNSVAPRNHPAPFTRTNIDGSLIVKPDVVEMGGNLSFDTLTNQYSNRISELAIPVANRNFLQGQPGGVIGYQCGTSLAAPKVSHLAGLIQAAYPDFSANLIRALIVNSAGWPNGLFERMPNPLGTEDGTEIRRKVLQLCGYGIPDRNKALGSRSHCITLYSEGVIDWDPTNSDDLTSNGRYASKVSFFRALFDQIDLRAPDLLDERVRVSITLAYNPRVRKTNGAYQSVKMYWDLKRPEETLPNFEGRYLSLQEDSDDYRTPPETWNWVLKPVLNPGSMHRRGTVIKDWFDTMLYRLPSELEIVVVATVNDWIAPPERLHQAFALVISIESLRQVPIYDRIRVRSSVRVQTR